MKKAFPFVPAALLNLGRKVKEARYARPAFSSESFPTLQRAVRTPCRHALHPHGPHPHDHYGIQLSACVIKAGGGKPQAIGQSESSEYYLGTVRL